MKKAIFYKAFLLTITVFLFSSKSKAGLFVLDSLPQYSFIRYDQNVIWTKDSTTLQMFHDKLWNYEQTGKGKIKIMHIGDSHIQAGYLTSEVRENFHHAFGCGTQERGFIFPYGMAKTNGPLNYGVKFTGNWQGSKSSPTKDNCSWGLSGIIAKTNDDSTTLKIYTNNRTFETYYFDKIKLFFNNDSNNYNINVSGNKVNLVNQNYYPESNCMEYYFDAETDTVFFEFVKKEGKEKGDFIIQGIALENDKPGITYSEVGLNGAKIKTFLACNNFNNQLKIMDPDLVIVSLGTNDSYDRNFNESIFYLKYDTLISQIKATMPNANIILSTPPDFKRNKIYSVKENIVLRQKIFELAQKHNTGVWDFYNVMGGLNGIDNWYKSKLVAYDRIHFNAKGYQLTGKLFYNAVMQSYENYTAPLRSRVIHVNEGPDWENSIKGFFLYDKNKPWVFSGSHFWIIFFLFFAVYSFVYRKTNIRSLYVLLFSLFFYYKSSGFYFLILIFSTLVDYFIGNQIFKSQLKSKKKLWVGVSVAINLLILGFFKYSEFLVGLINDVAGTNLKVINFFTLTANKVFSSNYDIHEVFLPVGISFFTFQTISYSIDIYRERITPTKNLIDFGFFVSFFPQLVAGPIVRANEFIPQIHQKYFINKKIMSRAIFLILGGLIKKIVISDYLSVQFVDRVFNNPIKYSGLENLVGIYGYALQIYCDFSAYSDIAIGLALLMGFGLPSNFDSPYKAINITDFWRRWHQSLSRWLKDYLYISLGGNRKGKVRTYINLMITMLLGGLWHGAAIRFIIWGGLHGLALAIHKMFMELFPNLSKKKSWLINIVAGLITFHFVCFCWILFRVSSMDTFKVMMNQIGNHFILNYQFLSDFVIGYKNVLLLMLVGYLVHLLPNKWIRFIRDLFYKTGYFGYVITTVIVVFLVYQFKTSETLPFIYFYF